MTKPTPKIPNGAQIRWLVRLEVDREPNFSDNNTDVLVRAVRIYVRFPNGTRRMGARVAAYPHRALTDAHNRATAEAATYYGGHR